MISVELCEISACLSELEELFVDEVNERFAVISSHLSAHGVEDVASIRTTDNCHVGVPRSTRVKAKLSILHDVHPAIVHHLQVSLHPG